MLQIYCGDGKGKTTAALGLAVRAAGNGMRVHFVQFLKGSPTSELEILQRLPEISVLRCDRDYGFTFQMNDEVGLLSYVLNLIADFGANILTIHQSIPLNGVASISITIQVLETTRDIMEMISIMEKTEGVHKVHITGRSATLT